MKARSRRGAGIPKMTLAVAAVAIPALSAACGSPSSGLPADALYAEHCARCHGDDGTGDPRQHRLAPGIDLTRSGMVAHEARGLIYQRISRGYGAMPGFAHRLERGDIEALTAFVLRFEKR
jgi:mono/diheme cytochrome c family protein